MPSKTKMFAAIFLACAALIASSQTTTDEDTVKALELRYGAAVQSNDIAFIAAHLAPTYRGVQYDGSVQDRDDLIAARKRNAYQVKSYEVIKQTIGVVGTTVIVTKCLRVDYTADNKHVKGDYEVSRVWQKAGVNWQVLLLQMTLRTAPCLK